MQDPKTGLEEHRRPQPRPTFDGDRDFLTVFASEIIKQQKAATTAEHRDRGRRMTNVSKGSAIEARRTARRKEEIARDLEVLVQRLAESREAIVRLLAAAGEDEAAALGSPRSPVTPLRALRSTLGATGEQTHPQPDDGPAPADRGTRRRRPGSGKTAWPGSGSSTTARPSGWPMPTPAGPGRRGAWSWPLYW